MALPAEYLDPYSEHHFDLCSEQWTLVAALNSVGSTPFWDPYCWLADPALCEAHRCSVYLFGRNANLKRMSGCLEAKSLKLVTVT